MPKVDKGCTTHHYACDCREERTRKVIKAYLDEHEEMKNFTNGFGKPEECKCSICKIARELY